MNHEDQGPLGVWSRRTFRCAIVLCLVTLLVAAGLSAAYRHQASERSRQAKENARLRAATIADRAAAQLNRIKPAVDRLAQELTTGQLVGESLNLRLQELYQQHRLECRLLEVGVAYAPEHNPVDPGRPFAPHFGRLPGGDEAAFDVVNSYDYQDYDWYKVTKTKGEHWIDPYFGKATQRWTAGYVAPFFQGKDQTEFAGVVRMNFDLNRIRELIVQEVSHSMQDQSELRAGYAFLLSVDNRIITHPIRSYIGNDISELATADGTLRAIAGQLQGSTGSRGTEITDPVTDESYWIVTKDIGATDWTVAVVFNTRETEDPLKTVRIYQRATLAAMVMFLCSALFLVLRVYRWAERSLWAFSLASPLILFGGMVVTWAQAVTGGSYSDQQGAYALDAATVEAMVTRQLVGSGRDPESVIRIPTGIFVQSLTFTSANNVRLTGYIWQKKSAVLNADGGLEQLGFIFPEAEELTQETAYENDDVVGWYFETTLRQQFDYTRYPFDREDVWIRLWPKGMNTDVILVPDFESYRERRIDGMPGVERDMVLEGWSLRNSYFSYRSNSYNVDFGQAAFDPDRSIELYFNLGLVRNFVSPFISDMIPVYVIAFLAFAVLMCSTKHEQQVVLCGFSTSSVLGYCAALFFVLIVSHVHLRNTLSSHGIIYMEYFYFVMYLVILGVSTDSLLFASQQHIAFIDFRDNLIVKLLYWPLLAGLLFVATLIVFL